MSAPITGIAWWTLFPSLVKRHVSFCNRLTLCHFLTAAVCPDHVVLGVLVACCRWNVLLLDRVFAAGGAAAFACTFFLALVLYAGAFTFTGVAARAAALWLNRICCLELFVG